MSLVRDLRVALSFLSRLCPARTETPEAMAKSLRAYPLAGLVIGLVAAAPVWLGLLHGRPLLQGIAVVILSAVLTRGLHWDGLMDLADAWGSGARGERFFAIMKDSRVGAFGVLGCVAAFAAQCALLAEVLTEGAFGVAVFGFVLGRFAAVALAWRGKSLARPGLGALALSGATTGALWFAGLCTLAAGLVLCPAPALLAGAALAAACTAGLYALARSQGALNGDFLGAAIILAETALWLGYCLATPGR